MTITARTPSAADHGSNLHRQDGRFAVRCITSKIDVLKLSQQSVAIVNEVWAQITTTKPNAESLLPERLFDKEKPMPAAEKLERAVKAHVWDSLLLTAIGGRPAEARAGELNKAFQQLPATAQNSATILRDVLKNNYPDFGTEVAKQIFGAIDAAIQNQLSPVPSR